MNILYVDFPILVRYYSNFSINNNGIYTLPKIDLNSERSEDSELRT